MASRRKRDSSFEDVVDVAAAIDRVAASLEPPRTTEWLVGRAGQVGCGPGSLVLDAGGWAGHWARRLESEYGCRAVVCDIAPTAIANALREGTLAVVADVDEMPFGAQSFDVVWCRDMLSMVGDPARVLAEMHRLLRPGGGLVLYSAFPTDRLEPVEREELFAALDAPGWWGRGAQLIRDLLDATGFDLASETKTSPEHTQAAIEAKSDVLDDWASLARLERAPAAFRSAVGDQWYEKWRAWNRWSLYLLLDKLETFAWTAHARR